MSDLSWCFSTLGCAGLSLQQALRLAEQYGLPRLEVRALNDRMDLPVLFDEDPLLPDVLGASIVQLCALDGSLKLAENTEDDRKALLQLAQWASKLNVPWIRVFDGGAYAEAIGQKTEDAILETLTWWQHQKAALGLNCELMIETHWSFGNPVFAAQVMKKAPEGTGLLWDTFHPWRLSGETIQQTWERLREWVVHVHFKDGLRTPVGEPLKLCSLGDGDFPLNDLFDLLVEDGFAGAVSLEWERMWHNCLGPLEKELARGQKMGWWGAA